MIPQMYLGHYAKNALIIILLVQSGVGCDGDKSQGPHFVACYLQISIYSQ